jgi:hemolysin D
VFPVPAWVDAEQAAVEQRQQIEVLGRHEGTIGAQQASLMQQLAQARAEYAHDVLKDLTDAETKEGELTQDYAAASRKAQETVLRAPITGTVQELAIHTVGGVVSPAQALMKVVPDEGAVLIEATVDNADVGFVHAGQDVEVKVDTFTFTRYGLPHGHVVDVSRDATMVGTSKQSDAERDDTVDATASEDHGGKGNGYVAHVMLNRDTLVVDGVSQRLEPGMGIIAEIKTGRRSVISYLLSPLARSISEAGGER